MTENQEVKFDVQKEEWGSGPWQNETDRMEWEHAGFPCLAVRNPMGAWCGYVGVPPGHVFHGVGYSGCYKNCEGAECQWDEHHSPNSILNVHGGITYSGFCEGHICHVPKPGQPENVLTI